MVSDVDSLSDGEIDRKAQKRSDQYADYRKRVASKAADIGTLHAVADPERKERCRTDLEAFLQEYFPDSTGLSEFSPSHRRVIKRLERCILVGGRFANAVFRGFGKSSIASNAALWAILYGHRKFVCIFGAEGEAAEEHLGTIKAELETNDELFADFPEVCIAVRHLAGHPQRATSQHYKGERTHLHWTGDKLVLPTVAGSSASGAVVSCKGITAVRRGMTHRRVDGTRQRPDFILLDDIQTDESARQPGQIANRLKIIQKNVLKLAGHNRQIAIVCNGTVIEPDDLMDQLCDHDKNPSWESERVPFVLRMPTHLETFWLKEYADVRRNYDPQVIGDRERAQEDANKLYRTNRDMADEGCGVAWDNAFDHETEVSAIQHAINVWIDDGEDAFFSEMQNAPRPKIQVTTAYADVDTVLSRISTYPRGEVPTPATKITGFIDVQQECLFYTIIAWANDFSGWIIDYGVFPEQNRSHFSTKSLPSTLSAKLPGVSLEGRLRKALDSLIKQIIDHQWERQDGLVLQVERLLIDANWGQSTDIVYQACREARSPAVLPSHGRGIGPTEKPLNDRKVDTKKGEAAGMNWYIPAPQGRDIAHVIFDANFWKSFVHARFVLEKGEPSCLQLFDAKRAQHQLFAEHIRAEYPIRAFGRGREVDVWKERPGEDNHWLDCVVGAAVAASVSGVRLLDEVSQEPSARKRRKVRMRGQL